MSLSSKSRAYMLTLLAVGGFKPAFSWAVGYNGFAPTETNVIAPSTGQAVQNWKQVGTCSNSATQISPSWILTANHSNCPVGSTFRRQDGASEVVDLVPPTQPGQQDLAKADLHLSRLRNPLPLPPGVQFSPLADQLPYDNMVAEGLMYATDILLAGYGKLTNEAGYVFPEARPFQVGWRNFGNVLELGDGGSISPVPANPHLPGFARITGGDSGGGLFAFNASQTNGALVGLLGSSASSRFTSDVKGQIDAVLSKPELNPLGEHVQWVDGRSFLGVPSKPMPPTMLDDGGPYVNDEIFGNPMFGLVTSPSRGVLNIKIPFYTDLSETGVPGFDLPIDGYSIRILNEKYVGSSCKNCFNFSTTVLPFNRNFTVGSGIGPGTWYMTVTAFRDTRKEDPNTGEVTSIERQESYAAKRIKFTIPDRYPQALSRVEVVFFKRQSLPDGTPHWYASFKGIPMEGASMPDGILWKDPAKKGYYRVGFDEMETWDIWDIDFVNGIQPGQTFEITAWPYKGAAIGPATTLRVTVPPVESMQ